MLNYLSTETNLLRTTIKLLLLFIQLGAGVAQSV
jgi:hypothetical protein